MQKKVLFFGTPSIAKSLLDELIKSDVKIVGVFCQPDREFDRNKNIIFSPVKKTCLENNIDCFQLENINDSYDLIKKMEPDIILTCAYGQFISERILNIPKYGAINFHASLLPKLRGGAPIHWAIINGEKTTGITLMYMAKQMDAGDIIKQYEIDISINDTYKTLYDKLSHLVAEIVKNDLSMFFDNNIVRIPQNHENATFGLNIKKEQTFINFENNAMSINNLIRGLNDKPVAKIIVEDQIIRVFESQITEKISTAKPGTIVAISKSGIQIATKDFDITLLKIQLPSKKPLYISEIINGNHPFKTGYIIK